MKKVILAVAVIATVAFASCSKKTDCTCTVKMEGIEDQEITVADQKDCAKVDATTLDGYVEGWTVTCKEK